MYAELYQKRRYRNADKKLHDNKLRMAEIEGIPADNPRKIRGDRCDRLMFEEFGSNPTARTS